MKNVHPCAGDPSYFAHKCCGQAPAYGDHNYRCYDGRTDLPGRGFYCKVCHRSVSVMSGYMPFALQHWNSNTPSGDATYTAGELRLKIPQWGSTYERHFDQIVIEDTSKKGKPYPADWGINASYDLKDAVLLNPWSGAIAVADVRISNYWDLPNRVLIRCNGFGAQRKNAALVKAMETLFEELA